MSFFNVNYFNGNSFFTRMYNIPVPSSYSNIKLFGGGVFGTLYGERRIYSDSDIANINSKVEQDWLVSTYINAKFNGDLQAGNLTSLPSPIDAWIIQRRATGEAKFTTIAEVGASVDMYEDRLVKSKQTYTYQILPRAGTVLGAPLEADPVTTNFDSVVLLDPLTNEGYSFCLNLQLDSVTVNDDVVSSNTKGKYNTILKGQRRFKSGSIGVIAVSTIEIGGALDQDILFLEQLEDFIVNNDEKILKLPNGMTYRVITSSMTYTKLDGVDVNGNTVFSIAFGWTEVGEL